MTSAPDEKTCEKSEFQGHGTGYREMGEVVCKAHCMTSTAGNGTEQPISAAQAKMRLPSLPVERSVFFFESAEVHFPSLQSAPSAVGFFSCCTRVASEEEKKSIIWGFDYQNRFVGPAAL